MQYELRIYRAMPGRLADLNRRFETSTLSLWEKHGIRPIGFWTVNIGDSNHDLYYMLAWEDLAERDRKWSAFGRDPEWIAARAASEENGPLVQSLSNQILSPTSYSKLR